MTHSCTLHFEIFHSTELWETPNFQRQTKKKKKKKWLHSRLTLSFSLCFLNGGGQLIGLNQNGWPFGSAASERSALTGAALSELCLSSLLGSVDSCQGLFFLMGAHACKNMYEGATRVNSPARSGCCFLLGLCSGPAVTSSLCLCCRWCASSLGYLSFCWRGTSLLFLLPVEIRKESK